MEQTAIDTTFLKRCIGTLERALDGLGGLDGDDVGYDLYRTVCVKQFELVLEQSGKLLRKRLRPWFASNRQADRLTFKDLFRHAAKHGLLPADACERWLKYRDNRNDAAHDEGDGFATATLTLLPGFITDATALADVMSSTARAMHDAPPSNAQAAGTLHLSARHRATLEALLREHLPDTEVWAYGSRVNGQSHDGSDLDLVLRGPGLAKIDATRYTDFMEEVGESTIPFLVEAHDWASLPERFHRQIGRDYVVLVEQDRSLRVAWPEKRIEEIAEKVASGPFGSSIRVNTFVPNGIPVISGQHLHGVRVDDRSGFDFITEEHADRLKGANVHRGDVVFTHAGTLGQVSYLPEDSSYDRYVVSPRQFYLRCDRKHAIPQFIAYYFKTHEGQHKLLANTSQVGVPSIAQPVSYLRSISIPVPPLDEQRAIVHVLDTLDDKIALNRRMNDTLEAMVRALFKSWFIDFEPVRAKQEGRDTGLPRHLAHLFPDRLMESSVGGVPDGWEAAPLSELFEINPRRSLRKGHVAPYVAMAKMPTTGHVPSAVINRPFGSGTRFVNGDTLVARITPCLENGKTAYVDFLEHGVTGWGSTEYIVMRPKAPLPNVFAYCLARTPRFREYLIRNMSGTSGRQRVSPQVLSQFLVPAPSDRCAVAFGEIARPLIARTRDAALESHQLAVLRDALLPALISGDLQGDRGEALAEIVA